MPTKQNDLVAYKVSISRACRDDMMDIAHELWKRGAVELTQNGRIDAQAVMETIVEQAKRSLGVGS